MLAAKNKSNYHIEFYSNNEDIKAQIKLKKKKDLKRHKKQKIIFKVSCLLSIILFTMISFFVLKGYSNISESRMNITKLENKRNELEQTKSSMISELEEAKNSVKVSEEAMYKLSMNYPNSDQVVYLSLNDSNNKVKDN